MTMETKLNNAKPLFFLILITGIMLTGLTSCAQKGAKRPSPADTVKGITESGIDISVAYSQPSIKGRTIGKQIAPYNGKPWRTGANEQTVITVSKDVTIEGHHLPAGKYSIWTIPAEKEWTVIINKNTTNFGTKYAADSDVFRFTVSPKKSPAFTEVMKFYVEKSGMVSFTWADILVGFMVK
jgi:hypothetical protein